MKKLILAVIILFPFFTSAQNLQIQSVTVPTTASSCTDTKIAVAYQVNCINFPKDSVVFDVMGDTIFIDVYYMELAICLPAIAFNIDTVNVGMIPDGSYTVIARGFLNFNGVSSFTNQQTNSGLNVISCCDANAEISSISDTICLPDTIQVNSINSGTAVGYDWFINNSLVDTSSGFILPLSTTGSYDIKLIVEGASGCVDSVEASFNVGGVNQFSIGNDTTICNSSSISIDAGIWSSYNWNTGDTSQTIITGNAGIYGVSVIDNWNCEYSDSIEVIYAPLPFIDFGPDDTTICFFEFPYIVDAYVPSYTYLWHDGSTDSVFVLDTAGYATCTVTNSFGCTNFDSIYVFLDLCLGTKNLLDNGIKVFPNPTSNYIQVELDADLKTTQIEIHDLNGRQYLSITITEPTQRITVSAFPKGTYILSLRSNGTIINEIIVIE